MKPSAWNAPEPTTVSSAILFHCATVFPGGKAAAASRAVPATPAITSAITGMAATRSARALVVPSLRLNAIVMPDSSHSAVYTAWQRVWRAALCADVARLCADPVLDSRGENRERGAGISGARAGRGRPRRRGHAGRLADAADAARAAPHAPERGRVDGPDARGALARRPARSAPEALVPCLEAAGDSPACGGGRHVGRNAEYASGRLRAPDRSRPARCGPLRAAHTLRAVSARERPRPGDRDASTCACPLARNAVPGCRPRGALLVGGRSAGRASPQRPGGPSRGRPRSRASRRADPRARSPDRRGSLPRAPPRPAHRRPLSRRETGRSTRGVPSGAANVGRGARDRAGRAAEGAPKADARPRPRPRPRG